MKRDPLANPHDLIRRVYSYVAYRIGPGSDAEDVTSETMLRAVRYRASYDPRKGKPTTWLIGIARTAIVDHLAARPPVGVELEGASTTNVENDTVTRLALADAIAQLEPRDQELVALRYGADLSTKHIAEILEMSTGAVDVALHRLRDRLREHLDETHLTERRAPQPVPAPRPGTSA